MPVPVSNGGGPVGLAALEVVEAGRLEVTVEVCVEEGDGAGVGGAGAGGPAVAVEDDEEEDVP